MLSGLRRLTSAVALAGLVSTMALPPLSASASTPTLQPWAQQLLILNGSYYGGFEGGAVSRSLSDAGWIASGAAFIGPNGYNGEPAPLCGQVYGVLGGGAAVSTQPFTIPASAGAPHFTLLVNVANANATSAGQALYLDITDLNVRSTPLISLPLVNIVDLVSMTGAFPVATGSVTSNPLGAWAAISSVDLSAYRGHTVQLRLRAVGSGPALFNVDEASVLTNYPQYQLLSPSPSC